MDSTAHAGNSDSRCPVEVAKARWAPASAALDIAAAKVRFEELPGTPAVAPWLAMARQA